MGTRNEFEQLDRFFEDFERLSKSVQFSEALTLDLVRFALPMKRREKAAAYAARCQLAFRVYSFTLRNAVALSNAQLITHEDDGPKISNGLLTTLFLALQTDDPEPPLEIVILSSAQLDGD